MCVSHSVVSDFLWHSWTVACQAPLSMEISRQEYWSGLPFSTPRDLPHQGIQLKSPALQADALPSKLLCHLSVQFSSVNQSCPTLCNPMDCSMPGLLVHHQLPEFTQIHVHWFGDAIQPAHPLSSPSPAISLSQYQGLFQWVSSSYQVAKVLEFQLQHQYFQWIFRTDFL